MENWDNILDDHRDPSEECIGDPGDVCLICGLVIPEPSDDLPAESWAGGFAGNH